MSDVFYDPEVRDEVIMLKSGGVTDRALPTDLLDESNIEVFDADEVEVSVANDVRTLASLNDYGNASRRDENPLFETRKEKALHVFSHNVVGAKDVVHLRGDNGTRSKERAERKLARINADQGQKLGNFRVTTTLAALWAAKIYSDDDGNFLPSSSGASRTCSFPRSASHEGQLGGLISATWATATNSILTMIKNIKEHAVSAEGSGLPLEYAIYGSAVPAMLQLNNSTKDLVINNAVANDETLQGEIPNIGGLKWISAGASNYIDKDGTAQSLFPSNGVLFLPASDSGYFKMKLGTYAVSATGEPGDPQAIINSAEIVEGQFSRAFGSNDPVGIKLAYGTTELPALEIGDATYAAVVSGF